MLPVLVVLAAFAIGAVAAQQSAPSSAPVYTAAQPDAGRSAYDASCSACGLRSFSIAQDKIEMKIGTWVSSCPSTEGGKTWQAMSYNPDAGVVVLPLRQSCMELRGRQVDFKEGSGGTAGERRFFEMPGSDGNVGKLAAYDVKTLQEVWIAAK